MRRAIVALALSIAATSSPACGGLTRSPDGLEITVSEPITFASYDSKQALTIETFRSGAIKEVLSRSV